MIKLTTLGSGTFFVTDKISASASIIQFDDITVLIDCGPGTLAKIDKAGFTVDDIDYVLITHLHPDHTSDLFPLFMNYRLNAAFSDEEPKNFPTFYGPALLEKYMLDYSHLTQLHGYENWEKIPVKSLKPKFMLGKVVVKTYEVTHKPFGVDTEAYALRFEYDNKVVSFSGDTADCPGVRDVCRDADVFICDASFPKSYKTGNIHLITTEIGEVASTGKVKKVLLNHFYPQFEDVDLVAEVKEKYSGPVEKCEDLKVIEID